MTARDAVRANYARLESYVPDADTMRVVCSDCRVTLREGTEPCSHGLCPRCERRLLAELAVAEISKYGKAMKRYGQGIKGADEDADETFYRAARAVFEATR